MKPAKPFAAILLLFLFSPAIGGAAAGSLYNISLLTDSTPDLTDRDLYLQSITSQYSTPQEQAISIWRWSQKLRKQTTNPKEDGHEVLDPILLFNNYGYCNCGIISGVNNALWLGMGWKAHYVQLGDHTVTECSWDDGKTWHMFDASMSFYCFNDRGEVASVREIEKNPRYYLENYAPECGTNPAHDIADHQAWRNASDHPVHFERSLANGYDSFKPPNDITDYNLYAQWGHCCTLNLRLGEYYTRYFHPLTNTPLPSFRPVRGDKDVDVDKNIRANGIWHYSPDLCNPATRSQVFSESGVTWTKDGILGVGQVVFKVSAANVVTSAKLTLQASDVVVSVSRDAGITWQKTALNSNSAELVEPVAGSTEYLVKIELPRPASRITAFSIDTLTQLNRSALPRLVRGPNRIQAQLGRQVETIQFQPSVVADNHKRTVWAEENIDVNKDTGFYKPTLRPAVNDAPCHVTWRIEAPTPITDIAFGGTVCVKSSRDSVSLLHSWNGSHFIRDYQKTNDAPPWDKMVIVSTSNVPPASCSAYLRYEFQTAKNAKSYSGPGIQAARMTIHHQPRTTNFVPMEITYCWVEHRDSGDVERQHTEIVTSMPMEYVINVGGYRNPTMRWVRLNLKDQGPDGNQVKQGYSDNQDMGPGAKPSWQRYHWGTNLALGKSYTLAGRQNARNPDRKLNLTDGVIAPPDTYVSEKYMPTCVLFEKEVSPVITIDLGANQTVAAVRIHSGQEPGFHVSHPDSITVETSSDGASFTVSGTAKFNQVFDPPADYVPWKSDESDMFSDLPAGGRLAYAYRVLFERPLKARYVRVRCDCRKGWGMLLSEVQVFDSVTVDKKVPPSVVLPALSTRTP